MSNRVEYVGLNEQWKGYRGTVECEDKWHLPTNIGVVWDKDPKNMYWVEEHGLRYLQSETTVSMTNHDWLRSLTTEELSQFLTFGLRVSAASGEIEGSWLVSLRQIGQRYIKADTGLEGWLKAPQEFAVWKGEED